MRIIKLRELLCICMFRRIFSMLFSFILHLSLSKKVNRQLLLSLSFMRLPNNLSNSENAVMHPVRVATR